MTKIESTTDKIEKIYGIIPKKPVHLSFKLESSDRTFAAGKAEMRKEEMIIETEDRVIAIPFTSVIPKGKEKHPAIIILSEECAIPNKYLPAEEIIDRGYELYVISANDICAPTDKKKGVYTKIIGSRRKQNSSGQLAVMAWTISRLAECIYQRKMYEENIVIAAGHGIYSRAAILAGGYDEKITHVIANGAFSPPIPFSEKRKNSGFTIKDMPLLYSPAFIDNPYGDEMEALLELCKSKQIMIGTAEDGDESDIEYEKNVIFEIFKNLETIKTKRKSPVNALWQGENFSYHLREGVDYFSRDDWKVYLDFLDKKLK